MILGMIYAGSRPGGMKAILWEIKSTKPYDKPSEAVLIESGYAKTYAKAAEAMGARMEAITAERKAA